jgi:hypothetical protein
MIRHRNGLRFGVPVQMMYPLEYYRGTTLIGWAAIRNFTVNERANQLPH